MSISLCTKPDFGGVDPSKVKILLEKESLDLCHGNGAVTEQVSDDVLISENLLRPPTTQRTQSTSYRASLCSPLFMPRNFIENRLVLPEPWFPDGFHSIWSETTALETSSEDEIDIKSGMLLLHGQMDSEECTSQVFVKIFGNKYEQHAQFYTDADYSEQLGYISLRNCSVSLDKTNVKTIYIAINTTSLSSQVVKLVAETGQEALEWARAFVPKHELAINSIFSPKGSPCLPRRTRPSSVA